MIPAYILGLWAGDKYWRASSIGISNTNLKLLKAFKQFFMENGFPKERIKLSVYVPENFEISSINRKIDFLALEDENIKFYKLKKGPNPTFILYVNSRPLKRKFFETLQNLEIHIKSKKEAIMYMAGMFDADGHFDKQKNRIRMCYSNENSAIKEQNMISEMVGIKPKLKFYKSANEWILDFSGKDFSEINSEILKYSTSR